MIRFKVFVFVYYYSRQLDGKGYRKIILGIDIFNIFGWIFICWCRMGLWIFYEFEINYF